MQGFDKKRIVIDTPLYLMALRAKLTPCGAIEEHVLALRVIEFALTHHQVYMTPDLVESLQRVCLYEAPGKTLPGTFNERARVMADVWGPKITMVQRGHVPFTLTGRRQKQTHSGRLIGRDVQRLLDGGAGARAEIIITDDNRALQVGSSLLATIMSCKAFQHDYIPQGQISTRAATKVAMLARIAPRARGVEGPG